MEFFEKRVWSIDSHWLCSRVRVASLLCKCGKRSEICLEWVHSWGGAVVGSVAGFKNRLLKVRKSLRKNNLTLSDNRRNARIVDKWYWIRHQSFFLRILLENNNHQWKVTTTTLQLSSLLNELHEQASRKNGNRDRRHTIDMQKFGAYRYKQKQLLFLGDAL